MAPFKHLIRYIEVFLRLIWKSVVLGAIRVVIDSEMRTSLA